MSPQQANKLAHQNSDRTLAPRGSELLVQVRVSVSVWISGDGSESPAKLSRSSCAVHYGDGEGGNGGIGGASGGDGARASEGRSLVLNACLPSGLARLDGESPCNSTCRLRVLSSLPIPRDD